jgi:enoyl-CoA hydratase/carnithine racemase
MTTNAMPTDVTAASEVLSERSGAILSIQMNRPAKKNAMTGSMYITIAELLDSAGRDETVRVVVLHAAGDAFTAGNDLGDFLHNPPGLGDSPQSRFAAALIAFDKPLIAAVKGVAVGGGTTLLGHCDFVYAGESARFQLPFVDLALNPEFASSYLLPLRIGQLRAAEMIYLGKPFDAAQAAEIGLVTRVVPDQQVLETAYETARTLAAKPPHAMQASKRLVRHAMRAQMLDAVAVESKAFAAGLASPEAKAVFAAFLAKSGAPRHS